MRSQNEICKLAYDRRLDSEPKQTMCAKIYG